MGKIKDIESLTKISLKIVIFLIGFGSFLFFNNVSAENNFLNILSGKTYTSGGINLGTETIISENEFIGNQALYQYYFDGKYYGIIRSSDNSITKIRIWDGLKNPGIDNFDKEIILKDQNGITNSKHITGYYSWQGDAFSFHILGYSNQKFYVYITGSHLDSCWGKNRFFLVYSVDTNTGLLTKEYHHGGNSTEDWSCYIPSYEKISNEGKIKINCSRGNTCGGGTEIRKVFDYDFSLNKIDFTNSTDFISSTINNQNNVYYNIKPFGITPSNLFNDKKYGIFGGTINTPYVGYKTGYNTQYCSRQIVIGELNNTTGLYDFYKYVDESIKNNNYTNYNSTFINNGYLYYIKTTSINSSNWACYGGNKTYIKRKIDYGTYVDIPGYNGGNINNVKEVIIDFDFSEYFFTANAFKINYGVDTIDNTKLFIYSYIKGDYVEIKSGELFSSGDKNITIYNKLDFISSTDKKLSIKIVNTTSTNINNISVEALLDDTIITNNFVKLIDYEFENIFADGIYSLEPIPKQNFQIYNYKRSQFDSYFNLVDRNINDYINQGTIKIKGNDITGLLIKFLGKVPGCYKNNIKIGNDIFSGCNSFTNYDGFYNNNENIVFENDINYNIYGGLYKKSNINICPIGYSLSDIIQLENLAISNNLSKGGYYNGYTYSNKDIKGYYLSKEGKVFVFDGNGFEILENENSFMYSIRCIKDDLNQSIFSYKNSQINNSSQFPWENIPSGDIREQTFMDYLSYVNNLNANNEISTKDTIGDPVNLNTGEFVYENIIMQYKSKGLDFNFDLTYKNQAYYNGPLGNNFDFGYNQFLIEDSDGNINYHNGRLGAFKFVKNENGFEYNSTLKAELKIIDSKYNLVFNNSKTYIFNENLKLESISDINGNTMTFSYDANNALIKIIDTLNIEYNITYNENSRIQNITDFNNNKVEFTYFDINETEGNQFDLKTIKMINGTSEKEINFTYTIGTDFESSHNIVKLIDSANNTYVENTYDNLDRVASQTYGNGTIYYNYTIDSNNKITKNSVTDREGNIIDYYYDNFGNTTKKVIKKTSGYLEYNYEYDTNNNLIKETNPLGNGFTYSYDANHNLIEKRQKQDTNAVDSEDDLVTKITYDQTFNKPTQIINSNGTITNLTLDNNGNVIKKEVLGVKDLDGNNLNIVETYEYNNAGELVKIIDANGNKTNLEYTNGNLVKSTKGTFLNTIETNYNYDTKGNIISITDGEGNITNLSYDDFNLLNSLTTPEGITSEYTYNKLNKKTNESIILGDLSKVSTSYSYDILDNPTNITSDIDVNKQKTIITKYDKNSNITEIKDGNNATIQFTYNEENFITFKTIINGTQNITTSYVYDENNRLVKQINPNGSEINFAYDLFDRIIKQTLSNGVYTTLNYDKSGNILETKTYSSTGILLQKESNTFDLLNRKTSNTKYDLENNSEITNKTYYDNVGNIVKIVDSNLGEINYTYDSFNRLSQITDKLGNIIKNTYNKNDKLVSRTITGTDGKIITTRYSYDSDNRLVSETNNLNQTVSYTYNNLNQVISKTDKDGVVTNYKYNYTGNLLEETTDTKTTKYEYDINGNKTKVIDANNNITTYVYDSLNRLVKQIYPDGNILTQSYDISGNLVSRTDPNGTIVTNNYDVLNRLTSRNIQTGTGVLGATSETYTYDELGRLTSGNDNLGNEVLFNYDSLNRLTSETNSNNLVNYTYDNNGNKLSINNINYEYDIANRLTNVSSHSELVSESIAKYTYDSLMQIKKELGNGVNTNYSYDELLRLKGLKNISIEEVKKGKNTSINENIINNYNFSYDNIGNIISNGLENYSYDTFGRIIQADYEKEQTTKKQENFVYDRVGNRLNTNIIEEKTVGKSGKKDIENYEYEINNLNQYIKIENGKESENFVYDNNGNLVQDEKQKYFYDYKNRLIKVTNIENKIIAEYSYDVLGRRSSQKLQDGEKIIKYVYAGNNAIIENIYENNEFSETKENIYSNNLDDILATIITKDGKRETYYYTKNQLGSITSITDKSGKVIEEYRYNVFGKAFIRSGKSNNWKEFKESKIGNTRLYTGREYDKETGLYYLRARYYSAELARFISRDPIDIADDINLYAYVGNNSVNFVDLMGLEGKPLMPPKTAAEHYARNTLNINLPLTKDEIMKDKNWKLLKNSASIFHSFGTPMFKYNSKFINSDGREAVYDYKTGELVTDDKNMGTYNYYSPDEKIDHLMYDIIPYIKWGNSENDNTTMSERIIQNKELLTAYNVDIYNSLLTLSKETSNNIESVKKNINSFNQNDFINNFNNYIIYR